MKKLALMLMAVAMVFTSCSSPKHRPKLAQVSVYHVPNTATSDPNDWLYYYLIFNNHTNTYYYYTSPTEVSNFSTVDFSNTSWATSSSLPSDLTNQTPVAQLDEPLTELPNEIEVEMDAVIEAPADYESGDVGGGSSGNSETEEDGDGDAGDGDSGSGDSGGDSGGGSDGGGGGGE